MCPGVSSLKGSPHLHLHAMMSHAHLLFGFSSVFFSLLPFRHFLTIDLFNDAVPKPKQFSQNKDHEHHKWRPQKSWISFRGYTVAQDKQPTQYLLTLTLKWKMLQNFWWFQNRNVQTYGYVYHDTISRNHGPNQTAVPPERYLKGHPLSSLLWEKQVEKVLWEHGWEKVPCWECLFVHREKGFILICVCGWRQIGCKETKYWSDVESTQ